MKVHSGRGSAVIEAWERELQGVGDLLVPSEKSYLLNGFSDGFFTLPAHTSPIPPAFVQNYSSIFGEIAKPLVQAQVAKEISLFRYRIVPNRPYRVNALGAIVEQKLVFNYVSNQPPTRTRKTKVLVITDCSRPENNAINDFILPTPFKYENIDDLVQILYPGAYMAVVDISEAYRAVPLHPSEWRYYGMNWNGTWLVDTRLPFGSRIAPWIFTRVGRAIKAFMKRRGFEVIVYLDDFCLVAESAAACEKGLSVLLKLLISLGFTPNDKRIQQPSQCVIFLGVEVDAKTMRLSLSEEKLMETNHLVQEAFRRRKISMKELQVLAGKLNWVCNVVYGGRTFLRRLLDLLKGLRRPHHQARVSKGMRDDLRWWIEFLPVFNGERHILSGRVEDELATDASGAFGMGGVYKNDWFSLPFPRAIYVIKDIAVKELYAILEAARRWSVFWSGKRVILRCDNLACVGAVNKGSSPHPIMMEILRELFWLSANWNYRVTAIWIRGTMNWAADLLSRYKVNEFLVQTFLRRCVTLNRESLPSCAILSQNHHGQYTSPAKKHFLRFARNTKSVHSRSNLGSSPVTYTSAFKSPQSRPCEVTLQPLTISPRPAISRQLTPDITSSPDFSKGQRDLNGMFGSRRSQSLPRISLRSESPLIYGMTRSISDSGQSASFNSLASFARPPFIDDQGPQSRRSRSLSSMYENRTGMCLNSRILKRFNLMNEPSTCSSYGTILSSVRALRLIIITELCHRLNCRRGLICSPMQKGNPPLQHGSILSSNKLFKEPIYEATTPPIASVGGVRPLHSIVIFPCHGSRARATGLVTQSSNILPPTTLHISDSAEGLPRQLGRRLWSRGCEVGSGERDGDFG
jgi:hypothetical protein